MIKIYNVFIHENCPGFTFIKIVLKRYTFEIQSNSKIFTIYKTSVNERTLKILY